MKGDKRLDKKAVCSKIFFVKHMVVREKSEEAFQGGMPFLFGR